jgi:hypothetical protein
MCRSTEELVNLAGMLIAKMNQTLVELEMPMRKGEGVADWKYGSRYLVRELDSVVGGQRAMQEKCIY